MEFTPVGVYLKVLEVGGKFKGANLEHCALVLFWVIEKACEKLILSYTPTLSLFDEDFGMVSCTITCDKINSRTNKHKF